MSHLSHNEWPGYCALVKSVIWGTWVNNDIFLFFNQPIKILNKTCGPFLENFHQSAKMNMLSVHHSSLINCISRWQNIAIEVEWYCISFSFFGTLQYFKTTGMHSCRLILKQTLSCALCHVRGSDNIPFVSARQTWWRLVSSCFLCLQCYRVY